MFCCVHGRVPRRERQFRVPQVKHIRDTLSRKPMPEADDVWSECLLRRVKVGERTPHARLKANTSAKMGCLAQSHVYFERLTRSHNMIIAAMALFAASDRLRSIPRPPTTTSVAVMNTILLRTSADVIACWYRIPTCRAAEVSGRNGSQ